MNLLNLILWCTRAPRVIDIAGGSSNLVELQQDHLEEYHALNKEQKEELKANFEEERVSRKIGVRINQRGRNNDVNNVFKKIEELVSAFNTI